MTAPKRNKLPSTHPHTAQLEKEGCASRDEDKVRKDVPLITFKNFMHEEVVIAGVSYRHRSVDALQVGASLLAELGYDVLGVNPRRSMGRTEKTTNAMSSCSHDAGGSIPRCYRRRASKQPGARRLEPGADAQSSGSLPS